MQVDDVPNVVPNTTPNVVPNSMPNVVAVPSVVTNAAPHVVTNAVPYVVTNAAPHVVTNAAPHVITNVAANDVPNIAPNPHPVYPVETDLIFVSGTTRLMLTAQRPLIRSVIHDAFENVRLYLLFNHAFPDAVAILSMVKDCLVEAANSRERMSSIRQRLLFDEGYVTNMIRLVSHSTYM